MNKRVLTKKLMQSMLMAFFCSYSALTYASVSIQIEPLQVNLDESFNLTLTQNNINDGGIPDLVPLQKDFIILGTQRRVNYSIINGQTESSSEWTISLKARKVGDLIIPSLQIGTEKSTPASIKVTPNTTMNKAINDAADESYGIRLATAVSEQKPYINQQISYKVTLYNSKRLLDADYQGPQVDNALLIPLGEEKRYQIQRNNVNYLVEEQNYAIFPQKSGRLSIKSPTFTALVFDHTPQKIKIKGGDIHLDVQPVPKAYGSQLWLPAKKVMLSEQYEDTSQTIAQGSTLVRTVTIQGTGVPGQLLPNLDFGQTDAFQVYPEKGTDKNQVIQGELIGTTGFKVTYLFNKAGKATIPELKLTWFNTQTGKKEIAALASRSIEVIPSATPDRPDAPSSPSPVSAKRQSTPTPQQSNTTQKSGTDKSGWVVAAFFAIIWLLTTGLWLWPKRNKNHNKAKYKKALDELRAACMQQKPYPARDALLNWAKIHWPDASILHLTDLAQLPIDIHFKNQIQILSQALYKNNMPISWQGIELWHCIERIRPQKKGKKISTDSLPPINPD